MNFALHETESLIWL